MIHLGHGYPSDMDNLGTWVTLGHGYPWDMDNLGTWVPLGHGYPWDMDTLGTWVTLGHGYPWDIAISEPANCYFKTNTFSTHCVMYMHNYIAVQVILHGIPLNPKFITGILETVFRCMDPKRLDRNFRNVYRNYVSTLMVFILVVSNEC